MATTINAATTGLVETSDGTAVLDLQTGGVTAIRVNATQAIGVGSTPSFGTAGQFLTSQGSGASPTWTSGGTGTVTSVSWTGGIVSIANASSTPAFTIAGTSGGIPYFSSASTWASSGALTQYGVVYGGGAGAAPVATAAGTTGQFLGANTGGAPTWQTPAGGSGAVVQVKQTLITGKNSTTNTSYTSLATTSAFTPTSASNKVLVIITCQIGNAGATGNADFAIAKTVGGTTTQLATIWNLVGGQEGTSYNFQFATCYLDSPATTSAITYSIQGKQTDGLAAPFVGGRQGDNAYNLGTYITLMEVTP